MDKEKRSHIRHLKGIAFDLNLENRFTRHTKTNNLNFIERYLYWFSETKILFQENFDAKDRFLSEFINFDTNGDDASIRDNFRKQYPIFKLLIGKVDYWSGNNNTQSGKKMRTNKCFLIHGHNETLKFELARLIEKELGLQVIILHEETNEGKTIIEKFETNSDVDFAIALWTSDDVGKSISGSSLKPRARQNVILETGYFFGRLGRNKLIVLNDTKVEIPSDYSGMIYISLNNNWKHELIKEIKAIYN